MALVVAVYWHVGSFGFLEWDDGRYVVENPEVRRGPTTRGLVWAFTTLHASNWHPVTWLSHMLDVAVFGLDAGWHHRVNVAWHAANSVLLFFLLRASTGSAWRSAFAAALFGVHPLNVESVAWVAERKNVLSTFFCFRISPSSPWRPSRAFTPSTRHGRRRSRRRSARGDGMHADAQRLLQSLGNPYPTADPLPPQHP